MKRNIQEELAQECVPIDDNLIKLTRFIDSAAFTALSVPAQKLLEAQATVMASYINILVARIAQINSEKEAI